jgi:hypothetical protein
MCNKQSPISAFIAGGGGGGGSVNTGVLQTLGGGALSGTLQTITDQSSNQSPLQLSTTQAVIQYPTGIYNGSFALRGGDNSGAGIPSFLDFIPSTSALGYYNAIGFAYDNSNWLGFYRGSRTNPALAFGNNLIWTPNYNVAIGHTSASARLHVRGVAGSSVTFFEPTSGGSYQTINSNFHFVHYHTTNFVGVETFRILNGASITPSGSGIYRGVQIYETGFSPSAGNSSFRPFNIEYTLSASGVNTATATGIFLNATETALNGMTHNLMNLQVDNSSKARISNVGTLNLSGNIFANGYVEIGASGAYYYSGRSYITSPSDGTLALFSNSGSTFGRLQLGGTTNAFPAIKRNGAAIDFVLANDSGFCDITAAQIKTGAAVFNSNTLYVSNAGGMYIGYGGGGGNLNLYPNSGTTAGAVLYTTGFMVGSAAINASAKLQVESTTQGFLPPRMTTTDRGNIVSPATGLKLYNTSTNNTDTFDGTNWQSFGKETKITGSLEVNIASGKVINAIEVSSAMGLGFYNAAAIIQPVTGGASATYANVSGTEIKENDTFDGYTIGNVVKALRDLGLLA